MRPFRLSVTRDVPADAATVWSVLADYHQDPRWRTGVVAMSASVDGLAVTGATTREELRLAGQTWINEGVIDEVVPGRRLRWHTETGADADGSRTVEPLGVTACRVTLELNVRPHGAERLLAPLLRRMLVRNLRRDLERLSTLVGAGDRVAVPQPWNRVSPD